MSIDTSSTPARVAPSSSSSSSVDAYATLARGEKAVKPHMVVLRISSATTASATPVFELLLGPVVQTPVVGTTSLPLPSSSSSSDTVSSSSWQLPALLVSKELNVLAAEDMLSAGTTVILTDYDINTSSIDAQVTLKLRTLDIVKVAPGWMTSVFASDDEPSSLSAPNTTSSATAATAATAVSPGRTKQVKRKSESPKKFDSMDDDDDDTDTDADSNADADDDGDDVTERAKKRSRRRKWTMLYDLDAESDEWCALVRVVCVSQDASGPSAGGRDDWKRRSLVVSDSNNQVMTLDIWRDLLPTFSSMARPGRLLVLNELGVKRIIDKKPWNVHHHELVLDSRKERRDFIEAISEEDAAKLGVAVPSIFKLTMIAELGSVDGLVNLVAVVLRVGELITFKSGRGFECKKRVIRLMDASKVEIDLTVMFKQAEQWNSEAFGMSGAKAHDPVNSSTFMCAMPNDADADANASASSVDYSSLPIIYIQNSKKNLFNSSLSLEWVNDYKNPKNPQTCIWVRPDEDENPMPEARKLRDWLDQQCGVVVDSISVSNNRPPKPSDPYTVPRIRLGEIKDLRPKEHPIYFTARVTVATILHNSDPSNVYYITCPVDHGTYQACREPINMDDPDCDMCAQHGRQLKGSGKPTYRMDVLVEDEESSHQFRVFDKVAEKLLNGVSAAQMNEFYEAGDADKMRQVMTDAVHVTWGMLCTASMSPHATQDVRSRIVELFTLDSIKEANVANLRLAKLNSLAGHVGASA